MQTRIDGKLLVLYTLLVLQVLIVMVYVASTPTSEFVATTTGTPVSFVNIETNQVLPNTKVNRKSSPIYQTITGEARLQYVRTMDLFEVYNTTLCWKSGLDEVRMRDEKTMDRCLCKLGWHGADCGQPEVVWRAIMASKQTIKLSRRRAARRLIYTFNVNDYNSAIAEVIVEELYHVVDFFVICDLSNAEDNFRHKLSKGLVGPQQNKIIYVNVAAKARKPSRVLFKYIWDRINSIVKNIRDDDIYVTTQPEEILNARALMFLKIYDGWPQPIGFRLRWSVYGFYWQHPAKTMISVGASTIGLAREYFRTNSMLIRHDIDGEDSERDVLGLVIGDLNHYGGWYCHYCQAPANIIMGIRHDNVKSKIAKYDKNVDVPYVEELIGTGLWHDGKTNLLRAYKSRDSYFAPETVLTNTWKYDWLVDNFYAKLDYY
ncbi:beta-1,4-mannosyl-glycoprotein 4-beta-N-acetylglucosaminyltransferase [Venturia canescens]|uniref:beta-1,4-mannosyl-glycoprotein 4-beta-N-acetylglucosaminyltransferase n=1 Tax=Venturia canescens TaxID=32260 RepID=UPI001C9C94FC|nr:beta-1,4-mannosyl-glycoprotein 4-beta-N-acetylglucosaminyltransferase [Venturia canescens]XP_043277699.1 beta-1,4-mannosyl-glycoprotein 4-beta-N-acetylglucosaminyltransferase [Venturia canescens]XP_043277700.1 beta-1,4-mannosyl-glycoprotein 4-beta-N-acetylglucosaminyltransferase [Venturia canescens]